MKLVATTTEPRDSESGPKVPPELASVPDNELVAMYLAAHELAEAAARSHDQAQEVVHTAYDQLLDTHRWDPTKQPSIRNHFLGLVKNELIQVRRRRNEKKRRKAEDGFQREDLSPYTSSAEAILLEREERQQREDGADRRRDKAKRMVAELRRRVAHHAAAAKVLEAWGDGSAKPAELAEKVGMTVDEVYLAKQVIHRHAEAIRDEEGDVDE
jgi:hypothetical protein